MQRRQENPNPNPIRKQYVYPYLLQFLIVFFAMELTLSYFLRESLYYLGLDIIISLNENLSSLSYFIWNAITLISEPVIVSIVLCFIVLVDKRRERVFRVLVYALLNIYLITVLKAAFRDPRPFWSTTAIHSKQSLSCPRQYGNPSGHSWFSTLFIHLILIEYTQIYKTYKGVLICVAVMILVPLSRMILGAHSLDQVVLGVLCGIAMVVVYVVGGRVKVNQMLEEFNIQPLTSWKMYVLILNVINFIPYFFVLFHHPHDFILMWQLNIESNSCPAAFLDKLPFALLMAASIILQFLSGISEGYASMTHTDRGRHYLSGNWSINQHKYTYRMGSILYYLLQIVIVSAVVPFIALALYLFGDGRWINFGILNVGVYLIGYLYSSKTCEYLYKYAIIRQEI